MEYTISQIVLVSIIVAIVVHALYKDRARKKVPLPPGPTRLPIVGNIFNKPSVSEWETYADWGRDYNSDVIYLEMMGTPLVVLNTRQAASDLLEKRGAIYSSRGHSPMVHDLMDFNWLFAVMPNNDGWRLRRRVLQRYFKIHSEDIDSKSLSSIQLQWQRPHEIKYIGQLLKKLVDNPDGFMEHLVHMVGSISLSTTFGLPILPYHDPYIQLSETGAEGLKQATVPGAFLVDAFPIMKYLPSWVGFQQKATQWKKDMRAMLDIPFNDSKKQWKQRLEDGKGGGLVSFVSEALDDICSSPTPDVAQEEVIKEICATIFMGTVGTTSGVMHVFMLAMVHHPDVQRRAQAEIDSVLRDADGKLRLPTHDDEPLLPYCTAIVKETLRWLPIAPIAIPHMSTEEDVYNGYSIPKGSIVIPNLWAMLHDGEKYPNPFAFLPERFLKKDGTLDMELTNDVEIGFGFGRRICPGRHLGSSIVWLAALSILATCDIVKARDENGNIVEPGMEIESTVITAGPKKFKCLTKPRSLEAAELIEQSAIDCELIGI